MGEIFLVRHAKTEWNVIGKLQGRSDIGLNEVGRQQAVQTREKIKNEKIDIILTSSLKRARETAEIINKQFNVEIVEDDRLMERCFGNLEGHTKAEIEEIKKQYPECNEMYNYKKNVNVLNIETMQDLCSRVYEALDEIVAKYKDKNVLIVSHGNVSIILKCYFIKFPLENLINRESVVGLKNCEVAKFQL